MDSPPRDGQQPQRLSALYQYHNAPEVAPAHGLEYDDTVYPTSDKYPVIRETYDGSYKGKGFGNDNRPPRIIFGMKIRTFLVVAAIMLCVIIGAAVGGAVGGRQLRSGDTNASAQSAQSSTYPTLSLGSSLTSTTATSTSTFSAPTPTYTPLTDCPASNATSYTSSYALGSAGTVPSGAGLNFTKFCDLSNPLSQTGASRIAEAFVYTFSDCVELCAGINFWAANGNCTVAVYQPGASRPGNCWIGHASGVTAGALSTQTGTDVALLDS